MQYTRGRVLLSDAAPILSLTATDRRPSAQTAAAPQRPPFAVSMHVGTPDRIHPVPKPIVRRAVPPPKPEVVRKSSLPSSRIPKAVKGRPRQSIAVPAVHLPLSYPGLCSPPFVPLVQRFPSFRGAGPQTFFFALRTSPQSAPRTTPYRIPRFKCTSVFASPMSNFLAGNLSFNVQTPYPSHTLMVQVVEDSIVSETEVIVVARVPVCHYTVNIKASPDSTATHASPASTDSCSLRKTKPTTNTTEDNSIMRTFIGELKSRLSWTVPKADSFVLASKSGCRPSDNDNANNEETSELHHVLALRRQTIAGSSYKPDIKSPPPAAR
ncbi:hypothetical protein B0H14DRAFT_3522291 [Mycena olivaceomarginata]|nr:hypothetical protein B0H14DRAFT_3522291 [Mycena olivaceomarginata]